MASSSAGAPAAAAAVRLLNFDESSASSASGTPPPPHPRPPAPTADDDDADDEDDPVRSHFRDTDERGNRISFKRRQKASRYSLFSAIASPAPIILPPDPTYSPYSSATALDSLHPNLAFQQNPTETSLDNSDTWSDEGPGRRVYDDLTAIDWIFEYTKERLRVRALSRRTGFVGQIAQLLDTSQVWVVLIATGIAAGLLAAGIDIVTNWLGDLKHGYCSSTFYLSRRFCCLGLEASDSCKTWVPWSLAFRVNDWRGGSYVVEYLFYIVFSILFAVTASFLVTSYATYARHSGIPEIKTVLGGFVIRKFMGAWTLVIKSIGLCLAVASGLWLGKEGPLVHVACCCANIFMKPFTHLSTNEARKREVLSAASAAGISVAFGSPIGGVLFSLEQLSYYFPDKAMWQSFVTAMVAAVTLQFMNPFRTGKLVLYQVKYTRGWHDFELVPFALLGILGGLYGAGFIRLNMYIASLRKSSRIRNYPVLEVCVIAFITALINYPIIFMRPQSTSLVAALFAECSPHSEDPYNLCHPTHTAAPILLLLLSSLLAALLASTTFGLQIPAGIILPSMAIGALYGRATGTLVQAFQRAHPTSILFTSCTPDIECVTPGVFAIIGAASALGGVTRMTVSIVVIMFELTGALTYVLPIMIAVMLSKWVGDAFGKRGIYESWIRFNEYPFLDNREDPVPDVPVREVMTRTEDLVVVTETGHSLDSLDALLRAQPYKGFPVVSDTRDARLVGYVSRSELRFALDAARRSGVAPDAECTFGQDGNNTTTTTPNTPTATGETSTRVLDLRQFVDTTPITLAPGASLMLVASLFQKLGLRYVLFATHGLLQGVLTKKDVFFVLNAEEEGGVGGGMGRLAAIGRESSDRGRGEGRRLLVQGGDETDEGSLFDREEEV